LASRLAARLAYCRPDPEALEKIKEFLDPDDQEAPPKRRPQEKETEAR
jgi:hypothetical protein